MLTIRTVTREDLDEITAIYNESVPTTATFDFFPRSRDAAELWFDAHGERHPIFVGELDGEIVGWVSLSRWSPRPGYDRTVESSIYVKGAYCGRGYGRQLKQAGIDAARRLGYHTILAGVSQGNAVSRHLNEAFGFRHVGTLREVGYKHDQWLDVDWWQLMLE